MIGDAVAKACAVMEATGLRKDAECPVCRGGWFFDGDECAGAVHHSECPCSDSEPPAVPFVCVPEREQA